MEIYNAGAAGADLGGWQIDDQEGGGAAYTLPADTRAERGAYLVVHLPGALLNNAGDTLRLIRPDGVVVDSIDYAGSSADVSRARDDDGSWFDSAEPTPGAPNRRPGAATSAATSAADQPGPDAASPTPSPGATATPRPLAASLSWGDLGATPYASTPGARYVGIGAPIAGLAPTIVPTPPTLASAGPEPGGTPAPGRLAGALCLALGAGIAGYEQLRRRGARVAAPDEGQE